MAWARAARALLQELATIDLGYPQGTNALGEGLTDPPDELPRALREMYRAFNGASMPDVFNGYFIDPAERALAVAARGEPTAMQPESAPLQVFGSDGGGGRFALDLRAGSVLYLPSWGAVRDNVYSEDSASRPRVVAESLEGFLDILLDDLRAFVHDTDGHQYLVSKALARKGMH